MRNLVKCRKPHLLRSLLFSQMTDIVMKELRVDSNVTKIVCSIDDDQLLALISASQSKRLLYVN